MTKIADRVGEKLYRKRGKLFIQKHYNTTMTLTRCCPSSRTYSRMTASNPGGDTECDQDFSFTTIQDSPWAFSLLSPEDEDVVLTLRSTLNGRKSESATSYDLTIASDEAFSTIVRAYTNLDGSPFTPAEPLDTLTSYWWRVVAHNADGSTHVICPQPERIGDSTAAESRTGHFRPPAG